MIRDDYEGTDFDEAEFRESERKQIIALQDQARCVFDCLKSIVVDPVGNLMEPLRTDAQAARWYNTCAQRHWPQLDSDMGRLYVVGFLPYTSWVGLDTDFWLEIYRSTDDQRLRWRLEEVFLKLPYYDEKVEAVLIDLFKSDTIEAWEKQTFCVCMTDVDCYMPRLALLLLQMLPELEKAGAEALGHIGGEPNIEALRAAREAAYDARQVSLAKQLGRAISRIKRRIKEDAKRRPGGPTKLS